jgi:hypothetical protein
MPEKVSLASAFLLALNSVNPVSPLHSFDDNNYWQHQPVNHVLYTPEINIKLWFPCSTDVIKSNQRNS